MFAFQVSDVIELSAILKTYRAMRFFQFAKSLLIHLI